MSTNGDFIFRNVNEEDVQFSIAGRLLFLFTALLAFVYFSLKCIRTFHEGLHYKKKILECYQPPLMDGRYFGNPPAYVKDQLEELLPGMEE